MSDDDMRQQQELEAERMRRGIDVLQRVDRGTTTHDDLLYLAAELGLLADFQRVQNERKVA